MPPSSQPSQHAAANGGARKRARTETDTAADASAPAEAAPAAAAAAGTGAAPKVFVEQASPVVAAKAVKNDAELVSGFEFEVQGCRFGV